MTDDPNLMATSLSKDEPATTATSLSKDEPVTTATSLSKDEPATLATALVARPFGLESISPELAAKRRATAGELVATLAKLLDLLQRAHRESFLSDSSIQHMQAVERWYTTLQAEAAQATATAAAAPEKTAI